MIVIRSILIFSHKNLYEDLLIYSILYHLHYLMDLLLHLLAKEFIIPPHHLLYNPFFLVLLRLINKYIYINYHMNFIFDCILTYKNCYSFTFFHHNHQNSSKNNASNLPKSGNWIVTLHCNNLIYKLPLLCLVVSKSPYI